MDSDKLDRIARTAGIIRNRATIEAGSGYFGISADRAIHANQLREFADDVLELVGLMRRAKAAVDDVVKDHQDMMARSFGITTADVDLFAPEEEPFPAEPSYLRPDDDRPFRPCGPDPRFGGLGAIDDEAQ